MRRRFLTLTALCSALIVGACSQTFDATTLGVEATMASPPATQVQGEEFRVNRKAVYLLWGMLRASKPSLDEALASQVTGTARVTNLRIKVRSRWTDVLFTVLTAGLVAPRTVTYEGVVVGQ